LNSGPIYFGFSIFLTLYHFVFSLTYFFFSDRSSFKAETQAHGWPSFRTAEVVAGNVLAAPDGSATLVSACGTKLGTNEPDADGTARYCMDLVCIAGSGP
jgi:peptide methionine sulfoxide reductase MsrB